MSFCIFIINLKTNNELTIIKEYIELKNLFLIILPVLIIFISIEMKKDNFSKNLEKIKSNLNNIDNLPDTKILISLDGDKKKYLIFRGYDEKVATINEYLRFETNQIIYEGETSTICTHL